MHALLCYVGWCGGCLCVCLCDMRVVGGNCRSVLVNINYKSGEIFFLSIYIFNFLNICCIQILGMCSLGVHDPWCFPKEVGPFLVYISIG